MDPFPNHIATVEDYLRCYKTSANKLKIFYHFTQYIVARTWKKMHRRIFSLHSLAFMYPLTKVGEPELRAKFLAHSSSIPTPKCHDTKLALLLVGMQEMGQISLIMDNCPSEEFRSQLTSLVPAFADVLKKKENGELSAVPEGTGVYTEATCYEFHQLLVASLMAYANALGALCEAERDMKTMKTREHCMEKVWKCTCLLWRIAYSQIFHQHVVLLARSLWLEPELPQDDAEHAASALGLRPSSNGPIQVDGDEDDADDIDDGNFGVPEDIYEADDSEVAECVTSFKLWVRLQVGHWVALEIASSFSDALGKDQSLKLHLLAVEPLNENKATMEDWTTTVKKLAMWQSNTLAQPQPSTSDSARVTNAFNSDTIIGRIQALIREYAQIKGLDTIIYAFNQEKPAFYGSDHCEVVTSALAKYADTLLDDSTAYNRHLKTILKVRARLHEYHIH
jgi:hypothetical protein